MNALTLTPQPAYSPAYRRRPSSVADGYTAMTRASDAAQVLVRRHALEEIVAGVYDADPCEAIGFLSGRAFIDDLGYWTLVESAYVCADARRSKTYVETTEADQAGVEAWRESDALGWDRVGWFHSHFELNVPRYSGVDRVNQRLWCPRPWQVGLLVLVDGGEARVRCYAGPDSQTSGEPIWVGGPPATERRRRSLVARLAKGVGRTAGVAGVAGYRCGLAAYAATRAGVRVLRTGEDRVVATPFSRTLPPPAEEACDVDA